VLAEGGEIARAADFSAVRLAREAQRGAFLDVRIAGHDGKALIAA
jgi:threonylcarbamoyladenosine tRNA methylthiotransferase MtaB